MKKLIALLLAMVMVFGLVACGNANTPAATGAPKDDAPATDAPKDDAPAADAPKDDAPATSGLPYEGVELTIGLAPLKSADEDKAFWDKELANFTAQTGAKVTVEVNDWTNLQPKYLTSFMSDSPYDVTYGWPALMYEFVQAGHMIDLTEYYSEEEIAGEFYWDAARMGDGVYGVAFAGGAAFRSLCCNMDILNECGITAVPTTWDELLAACAAVKEKYPDMYTYLVPMQVGGFAVDSTIQAFLMQTGGSWWNDDYTEMTIDTPEVHRAYEFMMKMVDNEYLSLDALGMDRNVVDQLFVDGKLAMTITDAAQGKFPGKVNFKWEASTALHDSSVEGVVPKSVNAIDFLWASKASKNPDAAVALIKYMNSPEVRDRYNAEVYVSGKLRASDNLWDFPAEMAEVFAHPERGYMDPMVKGVAIFEETCISTMQQIVTGTVSIDEGLKSFQAAIDEAMAE